MSNESSSKRKSSAKDNAKGESFSIAITVALITLFGTLTVGVLANWDKVFPKPTNLSSTAPVHNESQPNAAVKDVPSAAPKPSQTRTIELAATDNTCSFRDGVDFVSQKTESEVQAVCTGLSPNYPFTGRFSGVIKPDNPHGNGAWVDVWLTDSHRGKKDTTQPNFTRRLDDDSIKPHDTTLTGEVPASGKVTVYLVLDHCQTWTFETTCTTLGNSHLIITAAPKT